MTRAERAVGLAARKGTEGDMESVYVSKGTESGRVGSVESAPMVWCGRCECYRLEALDQGAAPKVRRMASGFVGAFLVCGHVVAVRSGRAS